MPGVGLQGGQVVRPAFQEQPFGGGPVPLLLMEKRQVHAGARQVVPQVRLVGEVGRQLLCRCSGPGRYSFSASLSRPAWHSRLPRLLWLWASSWRNCGSGGEVGRQLLEEAHGLVVVLLRFLRPARGTQQNAPVVVASGQALAELGPGGEVGRQLLVDAQAWS